MAGPALAGARRREAGLEPREALEVGMLSAKLPKVPPRSIPGDGVPSHRDAQLDLSWNKIPNLLGFPTPIPILTLFLGGDQRAKPQRKVSGALEQRVRVFQPGIFVWNTASWDSRCFLVPDGEETFPVIKGAWWKSRSQRAKENTNLDAVGRERDPGTNIWGEAMGTGRCPWFL